MLDPKLCFNELCYKEVLMYFLTYFQAHLDAANLLIKNVCEPLQEVAEHKQSQAQKLQMFRDNFQDILSQSDEQFKKV